LLSHRAYHVLFVIENMKIIDYIINGIEIEWIIVLAITLQIINLSSQL
jgi:hypothetical protein